MPVTPDQQKKIALLKTKFDAFKTFIDGANKALKAKPLTSDKDKKMRFDSGMMRHDAVNDAAQGIIMDKALSALPEGKKALEMKKQATAIWGAYRKALEAVKFK